VCVCMCVCVCVRVCVIQLTEYSKPRGHNIVHEHVSFHNITCVFPRYYRAHLHKEICKEKSSDVSGPYDCYGVASVSRID